MSTVRAETANSGMRALLKRTPKPETIDPELATYVDDGLEIDADGSIVSVASARCSHAERWRFSDRVEYEAFVNKVYLDDWLNDCQTPTCLEEKLGQALLLAVKVGQIAEQSGVTVAVIISADIAADISADNSTTDVVFRFHGVRPNEAPWLSDDIEQFQEPVLVRIYGSSNEECGRN